MKSKLLFSGLVAAFLISIGFSTKATAQCAAGFTYTVSGATVTFNNTSSAMPYAGYSWNYGDNTAGYYGTQESHSFANPGVYYVCLTVNDTTSPCTNTFCDSVHVTVGCYGLTASATSVDASSQSVCDGSATGSVTGGTAPYSYLWSSGVTTTSISGLCVGSYMFMVTDANGCNSSATTMVNCPFVCNDTFFYSASGLTASFYNYSNDTSSSTFNWNFGDGNFSNLVSPMHTYASAGTYNVLLEMNSNFFGCHDSTFVNVTVGGPTSCGASFNMYPDSFNNSLWNIYPSVQGQLPISYLWDFGDTTTSTQQFPTHNYTYACHHVVCLSITDALGCSSMFCDSSMNHRSLQSFMTSLQVVDVAAGVNEVVTELKGNTWPNPGSDVINVAFNKPVSGILRVTDFTGKIVSEIKIDGQISQLDVRNLPQGIYSVSLLDKNTTWNEKIVIVR
jgi:PKD repeat protein